MGHNERIFIGDISLLSYCKENGIKYDIAYNLIHSKKMKPEEAIKEALKRTKENCISTKTIINDKKYCCQYKVEYKGQIISLTQALKQFYKDCDLIISVNNNGISKKVTETYTIQQAFEDYCKKIIKKYNRG